MTRNEFTDKMRATRDPWFTVFTFYCAEDVNHNARKKNKIELNIKPIEEDGDEIEIDFPKL